jgi:ABC-type taurine transport system ATPase subunit
VSTGLDRRLAALATAVELAERRLDGDSLERARQVVRRAGERLGFGTEATVVALAGPTGAGKSTLFNALAGGDLARVSVRRPTTAAATAAIWGEHPHALLDWLDVGVRHSVDGAWCLSICRTSILSRSVTALKRTA